ncbi:MAG TPA: hypothetical protein VEP49_17905 [Acidimicrobiia bacterium]|nr:hypothetical protein [Acidimicrobiia bacterium]
MAGRRSSRFLLAIVAVGATLAFAVSRGAGAATVPPPKGAGPPVAASGIGTAAALDNPRCHHDNPAYGVYGRFSSTVVGGGPICVKPWTAGDDNGGATAPGVTKDKVVTVAVVPNDTQLSGTSAAAGTAPVKRVDMSVGGTYADATHDYLLPLMRYYETWGRDIEVRFVTSSGSDEQAQRADAVTIEAMKPFAVMDMVTVGLDVLDQELAKAKILVYGDATTTAKATAQAPYRWGLSDAQSAAANAAEVVGKQLVGKKARFAGSADIKEQTRKFAAVYIPTLIDINGFKAALRKYGGTLTSDLAYQSNGTTFGEDTSAQEQAPVMVTKMKNAGVTTVIMFSDIAMNKAMMTQATKQDFFPEWFLTGAVFQDIAIFARGYPQDQAKSMFGLSNLSPYTQPDPTPPPPQKSLSVLTNPLTWYWGDTVGTQVTSVVPRDLVWLMRGIHTAGPKLTPRTFQQGLFSIPASGGAAQGYTTGALVGYGKNPGLPYDEYMDLGLDFSPVWWDPDTTGPSNGTGAVGKGVVTYVDGAKRYLAGTWPKRQFAWFDHAGTVVGFDTRQTPTPVYAGDCADCPIATGNGQAGASSAQGFVAKADGQGEAAL